MHQPSASSPVTDVPFPTRIVDEVDTIVREADAATKPLEVEPYRGRLFELFVTADAAGYTADGADEDLTADGLCHRLSQRWGLKQAAEQSLAQQANLPSPQLQKMRSLWSVMRMWMEWSYAWSRWPEFHAAEGE